MRSRSIPFLGTFVALAASGAFAGDFHWAHPIASGHTLEIKGINGPIAASLASGADAEVDAVKVAHRGDAASVEIRVVQSGEDVTICAVYPGSDMPANSCSGGEGHHRRHDDNDNDVAVHFSVRVPKGVQLRAQTVNGDVKATRLASPVDASTVNGSVDVAAEGSVRAQTVNGSVHATLSHSTGSEPLEFETVNGNIEVVLPTDVNADLSAETVSGEIESDFPLEPRRTEHFPPHTARGRLGSGGRSLKLETVNGNIEVRKPS